MLTRWVRYFATSTNSCLPCYYVAESFGCWVAAGTRRRGCAFPTYFHLAFLLFPATAVAGILSLSTLLQEVSRSSC